LAELASRLPVALLPLAVVVPPVALLTAAPPLPPALSVSAEVLLWLLPDWPVFDDAFASAAPALPLVAPPPVPPFWPALPLVAGPVPTPPPVPPGALPVSLDAWALPDSFSPPVELPDEASEGAIAFELPPSPPALPELTPDGPPEPPAAPWFAGPAWPPPEPPPEPLLLLPPPLPLPEPPLPPLLEVPWPAELPASPPWLDDLQLSRSAEQDPESPPDPPDEWTLPLV